MKRKLIYAIIFISIFLMSSASMVRPVQGYENPDIPKEAKGMTLDDAEVTVYDEDEMEKHLGAKFDIKDIKNGDADIVGARSQFKITDWESDDDLVEYEKVWVYEAVGFEASADTIRVTLWELADATALIPDEDLPPIIDIIRTFSNLVPGIDMSIEATANASDDLAAASIPTWDILMASYADKYDGTVLEREVWDFLDPAEEFDAKADNDDDEVPYMLDPRDWYDSYTNVAGLANFIYGTIDAIQAQLDNWYGLLATNPANNTNLHGAMAANLPYQLLWTLANISTNYGLGTNYTFGAYILASYAINTIKYTTMASVPDKFGYLLQLLEAGQPCCGPAADFIKRAVKEFTLSEGPYKIPWLQYGEDWLGTFGIPLALTGDLPDGINVIPYGVSATTGLGIPVPLGGETVYLYANVDVEVDDAGTVEVSFEYLDDQQDPKHMIENYITPGSEDDPDELEDWEWVFPKASDAPTQMKDGDTVFYETTPMEGPIPGYEIPVLIGVSLVSVIGLIYVVMRKRKK